MRGKQLRIFSREIRQPRNLALQAHPRCWQRIGDQRRVSVERKLCGHGGGKSASLVRTRETRERANDRLVMFQRFGKSDAVQALWMMRFDHPVIVRDAFGDEYSGARLAIEVG